MYREMNLPEITESIINECINEIPIECDGEFVKNFILNGQRIVGDIIRMSDSPEIEGEDQTFNLTM